MSIVAVTGAAGRLGRRVVAELAKNHVVRSLDIAEAGDHLRVDVLDLPSVRAAVAGADAVVHLAALDYDTHASAVDFVTVNVLGTWNILQACRDAGVHRVVVCSSVAASGLHERRPDAPPLRLPVDETHVELPGEPYAASKLAVEALAQTLPRTSSLDVLCIRPVAIVFDDEVERFLATVDESVPSLFDYVAATDVARAVELALEVGWSGYDCVLLSAADTAHPEPTLEWYQRLVGPLPDQVDLQRYAADPRASVFSSDRARARFGWEPTTRFSWFREAGAGVAPATERKEHLT